MKHEQIRAKLEENYTHVTFVKSEEHATIWYVNEEMETIKVYNEWKLENILFNIIIHEIQHQLTGKPNLDKIEAFYKAMKLGVIAIKSSNYFKYSKNALVKMTEGAANHG